MKTEAKERMFLILAPHWLCLFFIEKGQSFMLMQIAMQKVTNRRAKSYFSRDEKLLFVSGFEFPQDAALARGLHIVEPLAVVAHSTVGARLHAF